MASTPGLEERLARLEEKVGRPIPVEERLAKVEAAVAQPKRKDRWEKAQVVLAALSPLVTGIALAFVGYLLNGTINNALEQRKLELGNVTQMRDVLVRLRTGGANGQPLSQEEMNANTLALAAFGPYSVPPLIQLLETGGDVGAEAAEGALRSLLLTYPAETCAQLGRALANRSQAFSWRAHLRVLRLMGALDCRGEAGVLRSYGALLAGASDRAVLQRYQESVDPAADLDSIAQLKKELDRTSTIIGRQEGPHGGA
jgi:hypothetical protein